MILDRQRYFLVTACSLVALSAFMPKIVLGGVAVGAFEFLLPFAVLMMLSVRKEAYIRPYCGWVQSSYLVIGLFLGSLEFALLAYWDSILPWVRSWMLLAFSALLVSRLNLLEKRLFADIFCVAIALFFLFQAVGALISLATGRITLFDFLWTYDAGRPHVPGESNTSSVPLGYLFVFCAIFQLYAARSKMSVPRFTLFTIFAVLTLLSTSRAAAIGLLVALVLILLFDRNLSGRAPLLLAFALIASGAGLFAYEKSFEIDSLDPSTQTRIAYYQQAVDLSLNDSKALLVGTAVGPSAMESATGTSFFESFLFNSLVQGGVLLFALSLLLCIRIFRKRYSGHPSSAYANAVGANLVVGNFIGGSNFFSPYAYLFFMCLVSLLDSAYQKER